MNFLDQYFGPLVKKDGHPWSSGLGRMGFDQEVVGSDPVPFTGWM